MRIGPGQRLAQTQKTPKEFMVIDHAEKPDAN